MKTIYSLREFKQKVLDIAKTVDENYVTVKAEITHTDEVIFQCYINKYDIAKGSTMEEALSNMNKQVHPSERKNIDVEIEMEYSDAEQNAINEVSAFNSDPKNDVSVIN